VVTSNNGLRDHLGYWLRRLSDEVHGRFERELAAHDVTVAQWTVLVTVHRGDASTTREVARYINIDAGAVSRLVDRLVAKGLMGREADPASRRSLLLVLTPAGRSLVPRLVEIADRNEAHFFGALDPAQRDRLQGWIRALVDTPKSNPGQQQPPPSEKAEK
jgi:MarR family transcriptional regulator, organic hydroperoxide resistance regulator